VRATNSVGGGPPSVPSAPVTPFDESRPNTDPPPPGPRAATPEPPPPGPRPPLPPRP
jgi:hypothetical protein